MKSFARWRSWQIIMFSGSFSMLVTSAFVYPWAQFNRDHGKWQLAEMGVGLVLMGVSYLWPKA